MVEVEHKALPSGGAVHNRDTSAVRELARLMAHRGPTIFITLSLCMLVGLVVASLRPASYRAIAKLDLADDSSGGGVLDSLALLARPPAAMAEIEALRSRTNIERAIAEPERDAPTRASRAEPWGSSGSKHLGLKTLVEDLSLATLPHFFDRRAEERHAYPDAPHLQARLEATEAGAPHSVRVSFSSRERVRLSPWRPLTLLLPGAKRHAAASELPGSELPESEFHWKAGQPIEWRGLRLWLEPQGDLSGRSFHVRRLTEFEAVRRVRKRLHVHETSRASGVIEVVFDDSDPVRAAETANAICLNFIERSKVHGERRAKQTLGFIEEQLETQTRALTEAGEEVLRLQQANPQTIDVGKAAEVLIDMRSELEAERMRLRMARDAVSKAVELLAAGQTAGLSRLSEELSDPLSTAYVTEIATLTAQAEQQDRSDTGAFKTLLQAQLVELQSEAEQLRLEIAAKREAVSALESGIESALAQVGDPNRASGSDPLATVYLEQLAQLHASRAQLELEFTAEHPDVKRLHGREEQLSARILAMERSRLEAMVTRAAEYAGLLADRRERLAELPGGERGRIATALERVRERTRAHLGARRDALDQGVSEIQQELSRVESDLAALPESQWTVSGPKRRLDAHTEIVKFLLGRQQEAEIVRATARAAAEFIDPAVPPTRRRGPSLMLHLFGGASIGLVLGLALAFVRESFDTGILSAAELESASGLPVFGLIPDFRSGYYRVRAVPRDFIALRDAPDGPIAEAFRSLRANLKFALGGRQAVECVGITSSLPAEGKSVTSINLALAFATSGRKVLLVDADLRWPSVHRYMQLDESPGLSEILRREVRWEECLIQVRGSDLHVVTSGVPTDSAGDLLDGTEMNSFLSEVRQHYDLVLFDLPPALAVADTATFASRLDAMVLLCRSRKLTRAVVQRTASRLRSCGANVIGAILNADRPRRSSAVYGYEYEYSAHRPRLGSSPKRRRLRYASAR